MTRAQPQPAAIGGEGTDAALVLQVIPGATLVPRPWKNGGGVTRQIAVDPPGAGFADFCWRLSTADVTASGPFSDWAGVDRWLVIVSGGAVRLTDPATRDALELPIGRCLAFPGERAYGCELIAGPVRDLNLMLRRGRASGGLALRAGSWSGAITHRHTLFHCIRGRYRVVLGPDCSCTLQAGDTAQVVAPARARSRRSGVTCQADAPDACLAEVSIDPAARSD